MAPGKFQRNAARPRLLDRQLHTQQKIIWTKRCCVKTAEEIRRRYAPFAGDLWQRTFDIVAKEFPNVGTAYNHVDAACIYFVQDPHRYDVIVTDNLFGDILTDLGGAVSGGIGLASSANLNPARTGPSMFEPVHGSAPDIVGTGKANPTAAILSAALMLDFLGENAAAERVRAACAEPVAGSTVEIANTIVARLGAK